MERVVESVEYLPVVVVTESKSIPLRGMPPGKSLKKCPYSYQVHKRKVKVDNRVKLEDIEPLEINCGKCPYCIQQKINGWIFRTEIETRSHVSTIFTTLTYANNRQTSVSKYHLQTFFKRLRKHRKFRYIAIAEYGGQTQRPHYHVIMFGLHENDFDVIQEAWKHGHIHVSKLTPSRISYVCRYHIDAPQSLNRAYRDCFKLTSRRPGIGGHESTRNAYKDQPFVVNASGYKIPVPTYYRTNSEPYVREPDRESEQRDRITAEKSQKNYIEKVKNFEKKHYKLKKYQL